MIREEKGFLPVPSTTHAWTGCSVASRIRMRRVPCSMTAQDVHLRAIEQVGGEEVQRQDSMGLGLHPQDRDDQRLLSLAATTS